MRRAVDTLISLLHPLGQVLLERGERREGAAGQGIALHKLDAGLDFAFRAGAIWRAGARLHVPVATERQVAGMKRHGPRRAIATADQRSRIVAEHREHHAAEMHERRRDALPPIILALVQKCFDEGATGITEDGDQQKHRDGRAGDSHALLAKVDLHLRARRRFHAHRRDIRRALRLPDGRHRTLHCPQPDGPALIA